jgi:hypothetical protein
MYKYQLTVDKGPLQRSETLKLVQERAGNTLELINIDNDFLNRTQMAQQLRERNDKWDFMKLESFSTTKKKKGHQMEEAVHRMEEYFSQLYI